ncbi:MAG: hypothetical protein HQ591_00865, partial [candidate division Zixibacteria bacterium]|nr:hypothetical protein [Candidatus Tariuqbacter arcticus]
MKTKLSAFFVLFTICISGALAFDGDKIISSPLPVDGQVILYPGGTDDPQPDTIIYDDNIGGWFISGQVNMWADVRFSPVDSFELRAVYIMVYNPSLVSGLAEVYCLQDSVGNPTSIVLAGPEEMPDPPPHNQWIYVEFETPALFGPLDEFHICYGPAPAGQFPASPGWYLYLDESLSSPRDFAAFNCPPGHLPTVWNSQPYGDYMVRAGGEYIGSGPPSINITLTPENPPIIIPITGGSFNFNIAMANNGAGPTTFDVWTYITHLGWTRGPFINVSDINLAGGDSIDRDRTQVVPANTCCTGDYTYHAYVGGYPNIIWDEDDFDFTIIIPDGGVIYHDWENWGESFDEFLNDETTLPSHPSSFILHPCSPNPFNPSTVIRFELRDVSLIE